jgi:hypothetical protein
VWTPFHKSPAEAPLEGQRESDPHVADLSRRVEGVQDQAGLVLSGTGSPGCGPAGRFGQIIIDAVCAVQQRLKTTT